MHFGGRTYWVAVVKGGFVSEFPAMPSMVPRHGPQSVLFYSSDAIRHYEYIVFFIWCQFQQNPPVLGRDLVD